MSQLYPTLAETIDILMEARVQRINVALPGRVEKYDPEAQVAECSVLVRQRLLCLGWETELRPVVTIPAAMVMFPRGGGHYMTMPVKKGDHVMLVFASRTLEKWRLTGDPADPITYDGHRLEDCIALPGMYPYSKALKGVDQDAMALGKEGGALVRIGDEVELGAAGGEPVAREGDSVEVTIPMESIMVPNPAGGAPVPNPSPIVLTGKITSGAAKVKAT